MTERAIFRLHDIKKSIGRIRSLLAGTSFDQLRGNVVVLAAFERFLEILSEAARHIPEPWREEHADIPWIDIASLGNRIRHEYFRVDSTGLWSIYENDLTPLERAVDALLIAHSPKEGST